MEKIGKVVLDDTHYPGEDLYSDGAVEGHILELVKKYREPDYPQVILKEKDWAVMYHLAHDRENILSWYPFCPNAKVLEVGSGCGAVTGGVAAAVDSVTCIDLSKKRSSINAVRHSDRGNIKISLGNFQDVEKDLERDFDYGTLIGVFEYGQGYIGGKKPYHGFLTAVMDHIRPGGKLLIAIENKFGLKYWAGCREDHVGSYFEGLEGYPNAQGVRTFTKPELVRMIEECGYKDYKFYYPYPDYKFPLVIYSEEHLPQIGELNRNIYNFDRDRLLLMDEGKVYDQILKDGLFGLYSNSFFVEITKPGAVPRESEQVLYTKYSSGRAPEFSIQTRIVQGTQGKPILYKKAEYPTGKAHITHIAEAKERLNGLWQQRGLLSVNHCTLKEDRIEFEYLEGVTLEEILDQLLEQGEHEKAAEYIRKALQMICQSAPTEAFYMTQEFQKVFGKEAFSAEMQAFPVADVDLIFSNLLRTEDEVWHVLDYEWTFFFPVPVNYILYRALHYYLDVSSGRSILKENYDFYKEFGIGIQEKKQYEAMERRFQRYLAKDSISLASLYPIMGKKSLAVADLLEGTDRRRVQVYLNYGQGFSEKDSYFIEACYKEELKYTVTVPKNAVSLWIDPALSACILRDVKLSWGKEKLLLPYRTTGYELEKNCYLFQNPDPKIIIDVVPEGCKAIQVSYQISILEEQTSKILMDKIHGMDKMDTLKRKKRKFRGLIKG